MRNAEDLTGKTLDKYYFQALVGRGNYGDVYRAVDTQTKGVFAIKVMRVQRVREEIGEKYFWNEIEIMQRAAHPNILGLVDNFKSPLYYFLVMKLCGGGDMQGLVRSRGRLPEKEAVRFMIQMLSAFRRLHEMRVIHRDLKLANILVDGDQAIIADFGFAVKDVNVTWTSVGTPLTRAPEIRQGRPYDHLVDIWSLGVCFYQMLFGVYPFPAQSEPELERMIFDKSGDKLELPKNIPVSVECGRLLKAMLQRDPQRRITWAALYSHPVFNPIPEVMSDLSIALTPQDIAKEMERFRQEGQKVVLPQAVVPEEIKNRKNEVYEPKSRDVVIKVADKRLVQEEQAIKVTEERLTHEFELMNSTLKTAQMLRKLPRLFANQGLILGYLLLKRGQVRFGGLVEGLKEGRDVLGVGPDWSPGFLKIERVREREQKLRDMFQKTYLGYMGVLEKVGQEQITRKDDLKEFGEAVQLPASDPTTADKALVAKWTDLVGDLKGVVFDEDEAAPIYRAMAKCFLHIDPDKRLPFVHNGLVFDWPKFEEEFRKMDHKAACFKVVK